MSKIGEALYETGKAVFRRAIDPVVFGRPDDGIGFYEVWTLLPGGSACLQYSPDEKPCDHIFNFGFPEFDEWVRIDSRMEVDAPDVTEEELWQRVGVLQKAQPFPVLNFTYSYSRGEELIAFVVYRGLSDKTIFPMIHVVRDREFPDELRGLTLEKFWALRQQERLLPLGDEYIVNSRFEAVRGAPKYRMWCGQTNWPPQQLAFATELAPASFPPRSESRRQVEEAVIYRIDHPQEPRRCAVPVFK